ncbi:serine/threonine-protein kinase [Bacillus mycoides]
MIVLETVQANLSLEKIKSIGLEGRNSDVYIAKDPQLNTFLVAKEITKESLKSQEIQNYFLEAQLLNEASHPHIMPIRYAAQDTEKIYITMPYYSQGSINSLLDERMLTVREILKYSLDFLSGLLFIHIKGMVHLDVKPTNIIINDCDRAILTDFGLSRYLNEYGLAEQKSVYTKHISPQYLMTNSRTIQDDIYQAGITIYRMCNGNDDFENQLGNYIVDHGIDVEKFKTDILNEAFPNRKTYLPHIPKKLRAVISKTLFADTSHRYSNVLDVINDLSLIDENLDWEYNYDKDKNIRSWFLETENNNYTMNLHESNGNFVTTGIKYLKKSKRQNQIRDWNTNYTSLDNAYKGIEKLLKQVKI